MRKLMFSSFEFMLLMIIVGASITIITLIINWFILRSKYKKKDIIKVQELKEANEALMNPESDFVYMQKALDFLDRVIKDKFDYYMYTTLLPLYLDNQVPEKKSMQELKVKIYVSVVGGLTTKTKRSILDFFTEKGIEIYIHEKIMIYMNKTDFKTAGKFGEAFRNIRPKNMDTLLP